MKNYNIIKTAVILLFLVQIISVIGQLGLLVSSLTYFDGSLTEVYGLGIGLLFILVVFAIIYYCIIKVDSILRFFKIDTLFIDEDYLEPSKINSNWVSLMLISIGLFISIPQAVSLLTDGLALIKTFTYSNGIDKLIMDRNMNKNLLIQNALEVAFGIVLITQSKYLGKWIAKKVIDDVKVDI